MQATYGFRATMKSHPGQGDALVALLLSATTDDGPATNTNCLLYLVSRDASDRDLVHVTEGWTSKEAHAANFARPQSQAFIAKLAPMVTGEARYAGEVPAGGQLRAGAAS
jgi:quinol monooxygenase YgiN